MNATEKHHFQAEIEQVLNIVINSLYTDKEIFVRELVSNASDACEKLRFHQASGQTVYQPDVPLSIAIETDEKGNTVTISDTGIGMTHGDLIDNLGTIAHSGSKAFLQKLAEGQKADAKLIGQFGVGFYSAFMAATKVTVLTRSYLPDESGWRWESEGVGGYEITPQTDLPRGTKIILQLKDDAKDFAKKFTVERIIKRYSNFVAYPIQLDGTAVNTVRAIWARNKSEIKDEEYNEFYQYVGHDHQPPLYRLHFNADAPLSIQALLFVPAQNFESFGMMRLESEVNLYCKKVLIQAKAKDLFPEWLRFLKGVVDSEDMPLNISRETMQDTSLIKKLNQVLTGRFIKFLDEQSEKDPVNYEKFYQQYSRFLKEGVTTDYTHREALSKLLRFETSGLPKEQKSSLADYVKRMPADQKEIYYLLAPDRAAAEASPYYEAFAAKKFEVLFLNDPWDEFVMEHLHEFDKKPLRAAEKADITLDSEKTSDELSDADAEALAKWMKEKLGDRVAEVKASKRLVGSPAVIIDPDKHLTASMRRILKAAQHESKTAAPEKQNLEFNTRHGLILRLQKMRQTDEVLAAKVTEQLFDNACVAAGLLEDPRSMLKRLNELLEQVLSTK